MAPPVTDDLFSDEEDNDEQSTQEETKTEQDSKIEEKNEDMADLFGSDFESDEEELKASGVTKVHIPLEERQSIDVNNSHQPSSSPTATTVFYNDSLELPRFPAPEPTVAPIVLKMPNILGIQPEECTAISLEKEQELADTDEKMLYRNTIRWKHGQDGERQSNTKLVEWSDGSFSMFVGNEVLHVSRQTVGNSTFLFVNETAVMQDQTTEQVLECQVQVAEKFTVRPAHTKTQSHQKLSLSVHSRTSKGARALQEFITDFNPEKEKEDREKINEDRIRNESKKRARNEYDMDRTRSGTGLDADFLEEGYDDIEYDEDDLGAIKDQYSARSRRKKAQQVSGGFDEYVSRRQDEDSDEEDNQDGAEQEEEDNDDEIDLPLTSTSKTHRRVLLDDDDDDDDDE